MKYFITILLLVMSQSIKAQNFYKYTITDKALLKNADKKYLKLSVISHKEAYSLGQLYEKIYAVYKDTSMARAIKCYESFCQSEDVYSYTLQQKKTAYKLGNVYEKGKGITKDTLMSITWYQISTPEGINKSAFLQGIFCANGLLAFYVVTPDYKVSDSIIQNLLHSAVPIEIPFLPLCNYTNKQVASVAIPISKAMHDNPKLKLAISFNISHKWTYTHMLDIQNNSRKTIFKLIQYIVEKEGIAKERVIERDLNEYLHPDNSRNRMSIIGITLENEDSVFNNNEAITLEDKFLYKENSHCSRVIWFKKDGFYYIEAGCENRSSISFGTYRATSDEIRLTPSLNTEPLFTMTFKDTVRGNWIKITDITGTPIHAFELLTIGGPSTDTLRDSQTHYPDSLGYYEITLQKTMAFTFKRPIPDIQVTPAFSKWYSLNDLTNKIVTLKFNYPAFSLSYPYIKEEVGYPTRYWINSSPSLKKSIESIVDGEGRKFLKQK